MAGNLKISDGTTVVSQIVRNVIKRNRYNCWVNHRKVNMEKRLDYAYDHINKDLLFWDRDIFRDDINLISLSQMEEK